MKITENTLKQIIVEEVRRAIVKRNSTLNEAKEEKELTAKQLARRHKIASNKRKKRDAKRSSFIKPKYQNMNHVNEIMAACMLLAWKGIHYNINVGPGTEYMQCIDAALNYVKSYNASVMDTEDNVGETGKLKDKSKAQYPGLVESREKAIEMLDQFVNEGYEFISKYIGGKNNKSKQLEKTVGLSFFGENPNIELSNNQIKNGAVFCVKDFFRWVEMGKPGLARRYQRKGVDTGEYIRGKKEFSGMDSQGQDELQVDKYNEHEDAEQFEPEVERIDEVLANLVNDVVETIRLYQTEGMGADEQKSMTQAIVDTVKTCADENKLSANLLMRYIKILMGAAEGSAQQVRDSLAQQLKNKEQYDSAMSKLKDQTTQNGGRLAGM